MSSTFTTTYENTCPARATTGSLKLGGANDPVQHGTLIVRPVMVSGDSAFGAEVSGVDWIRPIPDEIVKEV